MYSFVAVPQKSLAVEFSALAYDIDETRITNKLSELFELTLLVIQIFEFIAFKEPPNLQSPFFSLLLLFLESIIYYIKMKRHNSMTALCRGLSAAVLMGVLLSFIGNFTHDGKLLLL